MVWDAFRAQSTDNVMRELENSEKQWSNETKTLALLNKIINPFATKVKEELGLLETQKPALLVWDAFRAQSTDNVMRELEKLNIRAVTVPKSMTQLTHLSRRWRSVDSVTILHPLSLKHWRKTRTEMSPQSR